MGIRQEGFCEEAPVPPWRGTHGTIPMRSKPDSRLQKLLHLGSIAMRGAANTSRPWQAYLSGLGTGFQDTQCKRGSVRPHLLKDLPWHQD